MRSSASMVAAVATVIVVLCSITMAADASLRDPSLPAYCGPTPFNPAPTPPGVDDPSLTLKQVVMTIRHGDRTCATPAPCWPNDTAVWNCTLSYTSVPSHNFDLAEPASARLYRTRFMDGREVFAGDCETGQLTQQGYAQHLANGKIFNQAYIVNTSLLNSNLDQSEIFIRSDDEDRTIQSAQALLDGLYPYSASIPAKLSNIIDIHTMDETMDDTNANVLLCPKLADLYITQSNSSEMANVTASINAFNAELASKYNFTTGTDIIHFFDCLMVHVCHGYEIPISDDLFNTSLGIISSLINVEYEVPNPQEVATLEVGLYFAEMMALVEATADGGSAVAQPKFALFSGHDTTLLPIISGLNIWDGAWTPYASTLVFEVYADDNNNYFVRILYNHEVMTLPDGDYTAHADMATFDSFWTAAAAIMVTDPATQCAANSTATVSQYLRSRMMKQQQRAIDEFNKATASLADGDIAAALASTMRKETKLHGLAAIYDRLF